jgi:RND family efflux transporter MFP subunit
VSSTSRFYLLFAMALSILSGIGGCGGKGATSSSRQKEKAATPVRMVKTVRVEKGPVERSVAAIGTLAAQDQATVSVKVPGRVAALAVDLGTVVKKGDLLVQIEKRDYELRLQQAEAALAQARARVGLPLQGSDDNVEALRMSMVKEARAVMEEASKNRDRLQKLSVQGIISQAELEVVQSGYDVAANKYQDALQEGNNRLAILAQRRAEYEIARQELAETAIYAPFDGAIQERKANPGEYLISGAPIATVVRTDPLRLRLEVSERDASQIKVKQGIRIHVLGDARVYEAIVDRVSPAINEETRMLMVEADVKNPGTLRAGMFARAEIVVTDNSQALLVPQAALVSFAGIEKVLIVDKGKIVEKSVITGEHKLAQVEVLKGIGPGDLLVTEPGTLRTGDAVTVDN